ncbi:MAG: ribosome-binding factor A [Byssovorax sp.]
MNRQNTRRGRSKAAADLPSFDDAETSAAGHRHGRLSQIFREELAALVRDELGDPRLDGVIITRVELSIDYRNARVSFWVRRPAPPSRDERARLERAFERAAPFLRASLADAVDLKQVPALRFVWDQAGGEPE